MNVPPRIALSADARRDMRDTADFYRKQRAGFDDRYIREVVETLDRIVEAMLRHFPHGIFFRVQQDTIRVVAIVDLRRHPRIWQRRS